MIPAVFPLLKNSVAVTEIIGSNPVRAYRHGSAPQNVVAPYVTWSVISGAPENALDELPRIDNNTVQIDCWSTNDGTGDSGIVTLGTAVRNAIEPTHHITQFSDTGKDPETQRYRISMTFTFWNHR